MDLTTNQVGYCLIDREGPFLPYPDKQLVPGFNYTTFIHPIHVIRCCY